jgi:hypothetical protein
MWRKYWRFLLKLGTASFCKNWIITLLFEKNTIFRKKLAKIAEICDHNIDPCAGSSTSAFVVNFFFKVEQFVSL